MAAQFVQDPLVVGERVLQLALILSRCEFPHGFCGASAAMPTRRNRAGDRHQVLRLRHYIEERLWLKSVAPDRRAGMS